MKKNKPIRELFNNSLKKSFCILRTAIALLILGIMQAYANDTYDENKINLVSDHFTVNTAEAGIIQQIKVTGKVTDDQTGEAIPGVNIVVKGTTIGTMTDIAGSFSLSVGNRDAILVFSFIGYIIQEIPLNGRSTLNVALASEITGLEEVVVIGYGTQRKEAVTGSVASVKGDVMQDVPSANITQALQGRI